jgi:hypothetical protein
MADANSQSSWTVWRKLVAYAALIGMSSLAVYYLDVKLHIGVPPAGTQNRPLKGLP